MRPDLAGHAPGPRAGGWPAPGAHQPRIQAAVAADAAQGSGALAHRTVRTHLPARQRPRLQHHRSLHRPTAQKTPAGLHRDRARTGLPAVRGRRHGMSAVPRLPAGSLRLRLLAGTLVWMMLSIALTGWALRTLFQDHITQQLQAQLVMQLDQLSAAAEWTPEGGIRVAP